MRVGSVPGCVITYQDEKQIKELDNPSSDALRRCKEKEFLIITGNLTSESFKVLCKLDKLKELDLSRADIPSAEFDNIEELKNLKSLKLPLSILEARSFDPLSFAVRKFHERGVSIEVLDFNELSYCSKRTFEAMRYVEKTNFKNLVAQGWMISSYFKRLPQMTELEQLDLRGSFMVGINNFNKIKELPNLKGLKISLEQLFTMVNDSPVSTLDDLYDKGVSIEIDTSKKIDLRDPGCSSNITDLFAYAEKTKNFSLLEILKQQLTVDRFEEKKIDDIFALTRFKDLSLRSLWLPFNKKESIILSLDILQNIVRNKVQLKELDIGSEKSARCNHLDQRAIEEIGEIKSLRNLKFEFSPPSETSFDFTPLLALPNLEKLEISQAWLSAISSEDFEEKLLQKGTVKIVYLE